MWIYSISWSLHTLDRLAPWNRPLPSTRILWNRSRPWVDHALYHATPLLDKYFTINTYKNIYIILKKKCTIVIGSEKRDQFHRTMEFELLVYIRSKNTTYIPLYVYVYRMELESACKYTLKQMIWKPEGRGQAMDTEKNIWKYLEVWKFRFLYNFGFCTFSQSITINMHMHEAIPVATGTILKFEKAPSPTVFTPATRTL